MSVATGGASLDGSKAAISAAGGQGVLSLRRSAPGPRRAFERAGVPAFTRRGGERAFLRQHFFSTVGLGSHRVGIRSMSTDAERWGRGKAIPGEGQAAEATQVRGGAAFRGGRTVGPHQTQRSDRSLPSPAPGRRRLSLRDMNPPVRLFSRFKGSGAGEGPGGSPTRGAPLRRP